MLPWKQTLATCLCSVWRRPQLPAVPLSNLADLIGPHKYVTLAQTG